MNTVLIKIKNKKLIRKLDGLVKEYGLDKNRALEYLEQGYKIGKISTKKEDILGMKKDDLLFGFIDDSSCTLQRDLYSSFRSLFLSYKNTYFLEETIEEYKRELLHK